AYILLWIILPPRDLEGFSGKRLYRNPDDRIIGGVSGGLAAYFNARTTTIRLIFAAPLLFSIFFSILKSISWSGDFDVFPNIVFGSLTGTFILAYVILWMVLPEANSPYEKMEMRGEKVDVNRIRQNVKETAESMKDRVKGWGEEVKESAQNFSEKAKEFANTRGKTFANEFSDTARRSGRGVGHAIGVLFKVFFLFIVGTIAFGLFVALIALLFAGAAWWPINNFLWTSQSQQLYAWGTLIFFICVPLIGFIIWLIRRIIRVRSKSNYLGWTFGFLWTVGWIAAVLLAVSLSKDFREYEHTDSTLEMVQPANKKLIVAVSQPELQYTGRFDWMNDDGQGWDLSEDTLKMSSVRFEINASADSLYHVIIKRYSFGKTNEEALNRAEKIQYAVSSKDSILDLGNGYAVGKESKFRGQQIEIEIQVPIGKKLRFDESITDKLNPNNFRFKRTYRKRGGVDIRIDEDYSFRFRTGVDYTMGIDGNLKDETGQTPTDDYRYPHSDTQRINRAIELKEQEIKDLKERKKEQEQQKSNGSIKSE
ncbi:MAG TPA: PspC domain-containing protein, partial [Chitinophagaceae bacterium]